MDGSLTIDSVRAFFHGARRPRFMHVSANIIRFPEYPVTPAGAAAPVSQPAAEIIEFTPERADDRGQNEAQHHGQFFAAHRIVSRVADQLDAIAAL